MERGRLREIAPPEEMRRALDALRGQLTDEEITPLRHTSRHSNQDKMPDQPRGQTRHAIGSIEEWDGDAVVHRRRAG